MLLLSGGGGGFLKIITIFRNTPQENSSPFRVLQNDSLETLLITESIGYEKFSKLSTSHFLGKKKKHLFLSHSAIKPEKCIFKF